MNRGIVESEFKFEKYPDIVTNLVSLKDVFAQVIQSDNADVRKSSVFCLVEIHGIIGDELF